MFDMSMPTVSEMADKAGVELNIPREDKLKGTGET